MKIGIRSRSLSDELDDVRRHEERAATKPKMKRFTVAVAAGSQEHRKIIDDYLDDYLRTLAHAVCVADVEVAIHACKQLSHYGVECVIKDWVLGGAEDFCAGGGEATREAPLVHIGPGGDFEYRYAPSKRNRSSRDRAIGAAILIFVFVVSSSVVIGAIWSLVT